MNKQVELLKSYNKTDHLMLIPNGANQNMPYVMSIYDTSWSNDNTKAPYYVVTYLLDAYYCCPDRIDMSFLFLWQCINNIYNEMQFIDRSIKKSSDNKGLDLFIKEILKQLEADEAKSIFNHLVANCPEKLFSFVANTILKNYSIEKTLGTTHPKIMSSSYLNLRDHCDFFPYFASTFGESYLNNCHPSWSSGSKEIVLGIKDPDKAHSITRSLTVKLMELMKTKTTKIENSGTSQVITVTEDQIVKFFVRNIVYAVRCNTFHGNIASRLSSIYANSDSVKVSRFLFQLSHFLINLGLIYLNYLPKKSIEISLANASREYGVILKKEVVK